MVRESEEAEILSTQVVRLTIVESRGVDGDRVPIGFQGVGWPPKPDLGRKSWRGSKRLSARLSDR